MDGWTVPVGLDEDDGRPVWDPARGTPLLPGHLAWQRLGVGERRETWMCWSVGLWDAVVVKLVRPEARRPEATRALHREARALRRTASPLLPRLLTDGRRSPVPHLVVEFMNGPALDEVIDDDGPLAAPRVADLGAGLLAALRHLHAQGLAHLDVCPDNAVLVDGRPRLIDLGASRPLGSVLARGEELGSDGFIAPELGTWEGGPVTSAMDTYALGATLQVLLDPDTDATGAVSELLALMTDPDPERRPSVESAMAALVRHGGRRDARTWPAWADRQLEPPPRRARRRAAG